MLRAVTAVTVKRAIDVIGAALALIVLSPVLLVVAIAIVLDSGRPVLFRQARIGRGMEEFTLLKFRTMKTGSSPEMHREYIAKLAGGHADDESLKKLTADPRVTRVGRFLRRVSVDEVPQLFNVLRGDMSLVGPRPALDYELEHYGQRHYDRFTVKPGMTGLWQVSGRNALGFTEMLDLDVEYAHAAGVVLDLKILVKTPLAIVRGAA
jgi:lipopolysaccharide/colanic/teichoic acid biosynthesis glycosyltransferase